MPTKQDNKETNIDYGISLLRIIATISVIYLHTCSSLLSNRIDFAISNNVKYYLLVNKEMMNYAVPLFFMISGAVLIGIKKEFTKKDLIHYCSKTIMCLMVFGIPMAWMTRYFITRTISLSVFIGGVLDVFTMKSWVHLWYLYMMLIIYLLAPFIKQLTNAYPQIIIIILFLLFTIHFFVINEHGSSLSFASITLWFFYFLLGAFVYEVKNSINKSVAFVGMVLSVIYLIYSIKTRGFYYLSVNKLPMFFLIVCSFLFFVNINAKNKKCLWRFDRLCFGVYLIHPLFVHIIYSVFSFNPTIGKYYAFSLLVIFLVFTLLSFLSSFIINKINFFNKLLS